MDESNIVLSNDDYEVVENAEILPDVAECFDNVPDVARPLIGNAERLFKRIERTLYSAPSFISAVKAAIPEEIYQVILTDEQKEKIASGALKLMTKKDGSLMANLINPETKKIVSTVTLGKVKLSPDLPMMIFVVYHRNFLKPSRIMQRRCRWLRSLNRFRWCKLPLRKFGKDRNMTVFQLRIAASKSCCKQWQYRIRV